MNTLFVKYTLISKTIILLVIMFIFMASLMFLKNNDSEDPCISHRLKGPIEHNDKRLIQIVLESYLIPPPKTPKTTPVRGFPGKSWDFIYKALHLLFPEKKKGFFIEAGGLDGEYLSNTLYLENELGWSGLLVEPDPESFETLISRQRNIWASKSCISTTGYPHQTILGSFIRRPHEAMAVADLSNGYKAIGSILDKKSSHGFTNFFNVQCLPLASLFLALGTHDVDLIVLDVEDSEEPILDTFPWDRFSADVWIVEHKKLLFNSTTNKFDNILDEDFINKFIKRGYTFVGTQTPILDYIFVKNNSQPHLTAKNLTPEHWEPHKLQAA